MKELSELSLTAKLRYFMLSGSGWPLPVKKLDNWMPSHFVVWTPQMITSDGTVSYAPDLPCCGIYEISSLPGSLQTIPQFAQAIDSGMMFEDPTETFLPGPKPLEFEIRANCYVVIHLGDSGNWQFSRSKPPILFKPNLVTSSPIWYSELNFINADGQATPYDPDNPPPVNPRCVTVYFGARWNPNDEGVEYEKPRCDPFNLQVEIIQGHLATPQQIDPDIKNDGNQPSWPP